MKKRIQFFEFLDQEWLPTPLRATHIEYLDYLVETLKIYDPAIEVIQQILDELGQNQIHIACSGTGTFGRYLAGKLAEDVEITLSDLFPVADNYAEIARETQGRVEPIFEPVDALDMPKEGCEGIRIITNAFHHFNEAQAQAFLDNAVRSGAPIFIVEASERSILPISLFVISLPFFWLHFIAISTFTKKYKIRRLITGLLFPVSFFTVLFDGVISFLRSYYPEELEEIAHAVKGSDLYKWKGGKLVKFLPVLKSPIATFYFLGYPSSLSIQE